METLFPGRRAFLVAMPIQPVRASECNGRMSFLPTHLSRSDKKHRLPMSQHPHRHRLSQQH